MSSYVEIESSGTDARPSSFSGYIHTSPVALARAAREHIRVMGGVPFGFLRDDIEHSWRRSFRAGVGLSTPLGECVEEVDDLRGFLSANDLLCHSAIPEIDVLAQYFGRETLVILSDADASLLHIQGGADILHSPVGGCLRPGVIWREGLFGTNALGTTVVERRPVYLNPGEHYLEPLAAFACTAAPIMDACGELAGVLDITRLGRNGQGQDAISLVGYAARNIESRLFFNRFAGSTILAFHVGRHYLRSSSQGLLAIDDSGCIAGINQPGCQVLGAERERLLGMPVASLFQASLDSLFSATLGERIGQRQLPGGKLYYEFIQHQGRRAGRSSLPSRQNLPASGQGAQADSPLLAPSLQRSFGMALKALDRQIPVLLLGETGTGKEVAARSLHQASQRSSKPFVAVNCAAIPENLIESELFGYREGAFTGSRRGGMQGRLLQAHGGTLFLDEIGDMPLELQARLLRVLQERRVQPLGGGEEHALDVQLIGATHRNLRQLVAEGRFREDLFYRLNGVAITLPALRERTDFAQLVDNLIAREGRPGVQVEPALLARLRHYSWPGNVRQLQMVLQVALAFMEDEEWELNESHLTPDFLLELDEPVARNNGLLQQNEASLIRQALERHDGNVTAAASTLGISRATLYRKLKELEA